MSGESLAADARSVRPTLCEMGSMERRPCHICHVEGAVLGTDDYRRLRSMFDRAQRDTRGRGEAALEAALRPLYREYETITGDPETNWVPIIVHQLSWQPPDVKEGA
jgi:hypothetical protein